MKNIISAALEIEGLRPLLFHKFGPHAIPLEKKEKEGVPGNNPSEWRNSYFATNAGQLYLPPTYPFSCLKEGASYTKRGKANLRKYVASTLQVADPFILLENRFLPEDDPPLIEQGQLTENRPEVYVDVSGVRNPSSGGRHIRYRLAASPGWRCTVNLQWDKTVVSRGEMEAVCLDAGKLVGLGDGRSIGFGRFTVLAFNVSNQLEAQTENSPLSLIDTGHSNGLNAQLALDESKEDTEETSPIGQQVLALH